MHADPNTSEGERGPKLGDEWRDWDGQTTPDAAAPKRLFFALSMVFLAFAVAASGLSWYLVTPRLAQWHPIAPTVLFVVLAVLLITLAVALSLVTLMLLTRWPHSTRVSALAGQILSLIERRVFWLGRLLFINKDRLAHAFIRTNNALVRLAPRGVSPEGVLILLPRCLSKEQLDKAKALASARGVETVIAAGGEQARQRIREKRPSVVIGVACERDLLSGIRDVRHRLAVLGIANTRPDGPCRNTLINMNELERALDLCIRTSASGAKSSSSQA